jgi:hypothetical protein
VTGRRPVKVLSRREQVLELIEHHQNPAPVGLPQTLWQREKGM